MMKRMGSIGLSGFLLVAFFFTVSIERAHAYIDMGTGSLLLQMMAATFFGGLFTLKVFWGNITGKISRFLSIFKGANDRSK